MHALPPEIATLRVAQIDGVTWLDWSIGSKLAVKVLRGDTASVDTLEVELLATVDLRGVLVA